MNLPRFRTVLFTTWIVSSMVTGIFYFYIGNILIDNLKSSMVSTVSTAARAFDACDIAAIRSESSPSYRQAIELLGAIKDANPTIEYAYIMRKNNGRIEFVADAEGLKDGTDRDGDGQISSEEIPPRFGEEYVINDDDSVLKHEAWKGATVDQVPRSDRWGQIISAFSPIKNEKGDVVAILGIDVLANTASKVRHAVMLPFVVYLIILSLCVLALLCSMARAYKKKIETIKQLDKKKDEFLEIVTHELTFPIFSSVWFMQALLDEKFDKISREAKKNIKSIMRNLEDMSYITSLLLDASRVDLGKLGVVKKRQSLRDCLKDFLDNIQNQAREKGVSFLWSCQNVCVKYDRRLFSMALRNILSNAIKYTPKDGLVLFDIEVVDGSIVAVIQDNGIGIPLGQSKNIFKKYYRGKNTNRKHGNGLGLYVADGAVKSQGGTIEVESQENKGAKFIVKIPL